MNALKNMPHIEFFYDVVSPYSYFGFVTLNRYQKAYNLNVTYRPFYLGGISISVIDLSIEYE